MTALPGSKNPCRPLPAPRGFTLVELLVVVGIIAMLAALVTPAVIRARSAARNAAIDVEIDLLSMAMMTYRNEFGSFPPCFVDAISGTDAASRHLRRVFPRMAASQAVTQVRGLSYTNLGPGTIPIGVNPSTTLVQWLYGYSGDPLLPVLATSGAANVVSGSLSITGVIAPRRKLFDFDAARIGVGRNYSPAGLRASSYIYITPDQYGVSFPDGSNNYQAELSAPGVFFNPDTFQILCAGQDQIWGNEDDLSNFWRGTRQQHAASTQ